MNKLLIGLLAIWLGFGPALATNVNIDGLPAASSVGSTDLFECEQSGTNNKCTAAQIQASVPAVTNVATSCGVSGGPITSTGTISASTAVNPQTGVNYAFQSTDCGKLVNLSNASNQIPTISSGATLGSGWFTEACNQGTGTQTITPASGTIGGASTYVLAAGTAAAPKCVGIVSDGTNLQLDMTGVGGSGASPGGSSGQLQTNNGSGGFNGISVLLGLTPYISGNYYIPWGLATTVTTGSGAANSIRCNLGYFKGIGTIDVLGARITTLTASGNFQLAIYAISPTTGLPTGSALASTGSISTAATGNVQGTVNSGTPFQLGSVSAQLTPYAFCFNNDTTSGSTTNYNFTAANLIIAGQEGGASSANNLFPGSGTTNTSYSYTQTFGTWPSLTGVSPTAINSFGSLVPYMHFSSVP